MKKLSLFMLLSLFVFCACNNDDVKQEIVVDYNNKLTEPESTFATDKGEIDPTNPYGMYKYALTDAGNNIEINHFYSDWGFGGGFTYTNTTDLTTPGYANMSAITGKGKVGVTYLTSKTDAYTTAQITNLKADNFVFSGAWVTNTTYAYLAIKDGNDGYLNQTQFKENDWFKLTAIGYTSDNKVINKVDFYLADYRNNKKEVINNWQWFDWSAIRDAAYIQFEMSSSDNGEYGMKTPAYFSMDAITLIEK